MPSIVALDIETTGLDLQKDAITEIGAVRFNGNRVEDEWTTLVNPNRPIPTMITNLTGISNEMVRNAPPLNSIIRELADFVGNAPVLGPSGAVAIAVLFLVLLYGINRYVERGLLRGDILAGSNAVFWSLAMSVFIVGIPALKELFSLDVRHHFFNKGT